MAMNDNRSAAADMAIEVFNRDHLHRISMQNQDLAAEVLGLFLIQLPAMLDALEAASSPRDWAFATHTLKGSAAVIGAQRLQRLAADLEAMPFAGDLNQKLLRLSALRLAAAEFRQKAQGEAVLPPGMVVFPAPIS